MHSIAPNRRTVLRGVAASVALALANPITRVNAQPKFLNDPFQLGVASGDALADGFVIWTRIAPDPWDPDALPAEAIPVTWEVASDDKFHNLAAHGDTLAHPELAHSVHVEVTGLEPGRPYFYRFRCGSAVSRTGRTHTFVTPRLPLDRLRFGFASCQHYEQGYFTAYRDMIAQNPDFILHLGDYIYEVSWGTAVRRQPSAEARTLTEYRLLHAVYKTDPDLQAAHAVCPWLMMWDDHEVANDYSRIESERDRDPVLFQQRRAAAYQAYYEHMPVRLSAKPDANGNAMLYQQINFGDLVDMAITDQRQYRDPIACQPPDWHAGRVVDVTQCANLTDDSRSMLGKAQEHWLAGSWAKTGAHWNVLAQTLMLAGFDQIVGPARGVFTDNWGGYPAGRRRLLDLVKARRAAGATNFVSLGGDIHGYFVSDVKDDDTNPASDTLMAEFVGTSITSESFQTALFTKLLPENPDIKFMDDRKRGYVWCDVTPDAWHTSLRAVDNVRVRTPTFSTLASFVVENGKPGVQTV